MLERGTMRSRDFFAAKKSFELPASSSIRACINRR
jgi:hypothetical protein